jgi:hypothetical protein
MRVMPKRRAVTVAEFCVARGGVLKGGRVQAFIAAWTIASQAMGKPITLDEYADWWRETRSTAFRHQARFREIFPELQTPQPIANAAILRASEWQERGVHGIGRLPVDVLTT